MIEHETKKNTPLTKKKNEKEDFFFQKKCENVIHNTYFSFKKKRRRDVFLPSLSKIVFFLEIVCQKEKIVSFEFLKIYQTL